MDDDDTSSTDDLIESLASNATSAYETSAALNANPLNTALIYGGTATTAQGAVGSSASVVGGSGVWFILAAIVIIIIALMRE